MQSDFWILHNFLGLYQKKVGLKAYQQITAHFWDKDSLAKISFFLYQHQISNAITNVAIAQLPQSRLACIAEQTDESGQVFYYHWHNGVKTQIFSYSDSPERAYPPGSIARVLVYDQQAFAESTFPETQEEPAPGPGGKMAAAFCMLVLVLLYLDISREISTSLRIIQAGSLLSGAIACLLLFKEYRLFNSITERFCRAGANTGCNELLQGQKPAAGISLARTGMALYLSLILYTLLAPPETSYIHSGILLSMGAVMVSMFLFLKMVLLRSFCRLCLWIHALNLVTLLALYRLSPEWPQGIPGINPAAFLLWLAALILSAGIVYLASLLVRALQQKETMQEEMAGMKLSLMTPLLQEPEDQQLQQLNQAGQPLLFPCTEDCDTELLLVLSLRCEFCAGIMNTIIAKDLSSKISSLKIYLYTEYTDKAVAALLDGIRKATSNETAFRLLSDWYAHKNRRQVKNAGTAHGEMPAFCLERSRLPYQQLPSVFVNGVLVPHSFNADDLENILYYFSLPS